jgi:cell division cycle 2-like protein
MYKKLDLISRGAYGKVYLCKYRYMNKAVKEVTFETDDCLLLKSIIRETYLLKYINHKNLMNTDIIFIEDTKFKNEKKICYIMDIYSHNLSTQMDLWRKTRFISMSKFKKILKQLFLGINYLHTNNIIHRDIKPENILIDSRLNIKITDYGISKLDYFSSKNKPIESVEYVQTVWYRAPEVLEMKFCNNKSDMWSIGCIMFELLSLRTYVLFGYDKPGDVLAAILKTFLVYNISDEVYKTYELDKKNIFQNYEKFNLDTRIKNSAYIYNIQYNDLMKKILEYDSEKRYSAEDCLNHTFLKENKKLTEVDLSISKNVNDEIKYVDNLNDFQPGDTSYLIKVLENILKSH